MVVHLLLIKYFSLDAKGSAFMKRNRHVSLFLPVKKTALLSLDSHNSQWELMLSRKHKTSEPDLDF